MSLAVGKKLGMFEVSTLLGVGGMGEVYRARDTKLGREVAIKVLPAEFSNDRDRLARFQREARLLAVLNHPNVAHIHGLEEADGVQFLVMELVEGETLADRLEKGPLPLAEIYKVFGQIAEGLEAAHQQGVIHRDLKPANIKITDDGKVSVLDFGLAKAAELKSSATNDGVTSPWDDNSAGKSAVGQIVGTPAYMSPEQARGKAVDKRTDIWAFGCCLYEALTGHRAFRGETVSDTLAMILAAEPDWEELPKAAPPRLRELLQRCLAKDLRGRLCDIGDARLELSGIAGNPEVAPTPDRSRFGRSRFVTATLGLIVGSLTATAILWNSSHRTEPTDKPIHLSQGIIQLTMDLPIEAPISTSLVTGRNHQCALSADGSRLVYAGGKVGEEQLYLRPLGQLKASPLSGTGGAAHPSFSPDGQWIAFAAEGQMKKVRLDGSRPVALCKLRNPWGIAWAEDDQIYFADSAGTVSPLNGGLKRVHSSGGEPQLVTHNDDAGNINGHILPHSVPGGDSVLFTLAKAAGPDPSSIAVLSIKTGKWKVILPEATQAQLTSTGYLLFRNRGWINAAHFNLSHLEVDGPRIPIFRSLVQPQISKAGCLIYAPPTSGAAGDELVPNRSLVWVSRQGEVEPLNAPPRPYRSVRLSPDGKQLAAVIEPDRDIWIYDFERENLSRLTFGGMSVSPTWTPDSQRLVFGFDRKGKTFNLFSVPADGSAQPRSLAESDSYQLPFSISPDGKVVAFIQNQRETGFDIFVRPVDGEGTAKPLIQTEFVETFPAFSPDGKWLAYTSDETGRQEIFIQPYPPTAVKWQISTQGGKEPLWSPKGSELFYRSGAKLFAVHLETEPAFKPGHPRILFEKMFLDTNRSYGISPDGDRFLFVQLSETDEAQAEIHQLVVVQNWFEELKRLMSTESSAGK